MPNFPFWFLEGNCKQHIEDQITLQQYTYMINHIGLVYRSILLVFAISLLPIWYLHEMICKISNFSNCLCYTFQPPNDEFRITREDLISGLRGCLSACPEFGPLCVPLLLDKMQSDVQSAILDSLLTLVCVYLYDVLS